MTNQEEILYAIKEAISVMEHYNNGEDFALVSSLRRMHELEQKLQQHDVSGSVAYTKVCKLLVALNDIKTWDDDSEDEWEDPGYRAKAALAEYYKATDR